MRNKIHANLFVTYILSNFCWILSATIEVLYRAINTNYRDFIRREKSFQSLSIIFCQYGSTVCTVYSRYTVVYEMKNRVEIEG